MVADPDLKQTKSGVDRCTFTMAVNAFRKEKDPLFLKVSSYRNSAKFANDYLSKGSAVLVQGELQINAYLDDDGDRRWWTEVVANNIQALGKRQEQLSLENLT